MYYTNEELHKLGFKFVGKNVKVSNRASIYDAGQIELGDNSRIDDFCVVSGKVKIGRHVHITPCCLVAGGEQGIEFFDFSCLAYRVSIFSQSDDYSGETMTNSTVPAEYKNEFKKKVIVEKHVIVGAGSIIMPGVKLSEGTSVGAMSLVTKTTEPWGIYVGSPAKKIKNRSKKLLELEQKFLLS